MQIERQKQNRQNYSYDCQSGDGEESKFGDGGKAKLKNTLSNRHHVVLPFDCHAIRTCEI